MCMTTFDSYDTSSREFTIVPMLNPSLKSRAYLNVQLITISAVVKIELCSCSCKFVSVRVKNRAEKREMLRE